MIKQWLALILIFMFPLTAISAPSDVLKIGRKQEAPPPKIIESSPTKIPKNNATIKPQVKPSKNHIITKPIPPEYIARNFRYTDKHSPKYANNRGWSTEQINQLIENPYTIRDAKHKFNNYSPATAYFRKDGHHIVVDNHDKRLVHVSDSKKIIGKLDKKIHWKTNDRIIVNPYIPKHAPGYK